MELSLTVLLIIGFLSFVTEYVDATLGMGYGTSLAAILLLMGYSPLDFVPPLLISQFVAGMFAGLSVISSKSLVYTTGDHATIPVPPGVPLFVTM